MREPLHVALASCRELPEPDPDAAPLEHRRRHHPAQPPPARPLEPPQEPPARPRAARRSDRPDDARPPRDLVVHGDALVQRYLPSVEDHGERALVWIDGEVTHAVRKEPRFAGGVESVGDAVDVAPGPAGEPVVMELELVEPSLFLDQGPAALGRLVDALARRLGR